MMCGALFGCRFEESLEYSGINILFVGVESTTRRPVLTEKPFVWTQPIQQPQHFVLKLHNIEIWITQVFDVEGSIRRLKLPIDPLQ
jgi:hypothetical protein